MADPAEWNRLVAGLPVRSLLQSWGWGTVQERLGWRPEALALERAGEPLGAALCLRKSLARRLHRLFVPRGPALAGPEHFLEAVEALARRDPAAVYLRVEPECPAEDLPADPRLQVAPSRPLEYTYLLDLSGGLEAALARIPRGARYGMLLGRRRGLSVEAEDDPAVLHGLLAETSRRNPLAPLPDRSSCEALLAGLRQPQGGAAVLVARSEGRPLAALLLAWFAGRGYALLAGSNRERPSLRPSHALYLGAVERLVAEGMREFDLHGAPGPTVEGHSAAGVREFKRQFGGRLVHFGRWDRPRPWLYPPFRLLEALREARNRRRRG